MILPRFAKSMAAVALFNGALLLVVSEEASAQIKSVEARKATESLMTAKDAKTKIAALDELGRLGSIQKALAKDAVPKMFELLKDSDAGVRAAAASALGRAGADASKAVPALVELLKKDADEKVKIGATRGLAAMGPEAKEAGPPLREIVKAADKKSALGKAAGDALKSINMKGG